ncbi:TetR/AcrR family transcriptional regulator [Solimonas sp. K1W22B-7]|uniref:TetR/AcrR family transcriptional regulator n=1 Tax=Solimonas sp. K1W22B-7 TaxID=2303331 RepID=UPI0013C454F1|nr:TetR/AcrR family transcriptional regulator [Solimonas sp. K1W22B-7]
MMQILNKHQEIKEMGAKKITKRPAAKRRRTQAERSDAMRQRLVDATLDCLAADGYAGATIGKIAARAKVSHGATGHHFETKSDLIVAAAEELILRTSQLLEDLVRGMEEGDDRLAALTNALWAKLHSQPAMRAYLELTVAAQRDKPLAKALGALEGRTAVMFEQGANLLFEARPGVKESPHSLFVLTRSLLLGLAVQFHSGGNDGFMREQIDAWVRMMSTQFRARRGVLPPPPPSRA